MRLGLDRVRRLLGAFDDPHLTTPVVLIAGTNGKGSTAALVAAMGRAAGYRVGLYTSPHLEQVTERIVLGERPIEDRSLAGYLEEILERAGAADAAPTYFEALTTAAFLYFHDSRAELAVMEVGLGGRLDATNVCEPVLSLISSIDLDHERHLGTSLAVIAGEKGGILRRGKPAIAWVEGEAADALEAQAAALGCDLVLAPRQVRITDSPPEPGNPSPLRDLSLQTARRDYRLTLPLAGAHQRRNLGLAVLAAEALAARGWSRLDTAAIAAGSRRCRWPGRLETVTLADGRRVLLDTAHNPAAVAALCEHLRTLNESPDLLFGAMRDKNVSAMLPPIAASSRRVVLTRPRASRAEGPPGDGPRGGDPRAWTSLVKAPVAIETDPARALEKALDGSSSLLVVCGSIYLVGEVRRLLRERYGAFSRR
ncbi:MAG: cyanophycin synthetase [Thermoanaerobaculia bacterium]